MKKYLLTTLMALLFLGGAFAQENNKVDKSLYLLRGINSDSIEVYQKALLSIDIEDYRLIDEDRVIKFSNGGEVLLFSSKSLNEKYSRAIRPNNLSYSKHEIIFSIENDKIIVSKIKLN